MGGKKQVWRIAAVGALAGAALTAPAHGAGEDLVGNTAGSAVQRVAKSNRRAPTASDRRASSGAARRSASARGADSRDVRGKARSKVGRVQARAVSSDDAVATAAQAGETAEPVVTGAQPSVDSGASLPFTGADLALLIALGLAAMGTGLALRRVAAA